MTPFSQFRPIAKFFTVLLSLSIALSVLQVITSFNPSELISYLAFVDLAIAVFILYSTLNRMKAGWWLLLVINFLSIAACLIKMVFLIRIEAFDSNIASMLALKYCIPALLLAFLFTYGIRRHYRIADRKSA